MFDYYFKENFMSEGQYLYAERSVVMLIDLIKAFEWNIFKRYHLREVASVKSFW